MKHKMCRYIWANSNTLCIYLSGPALDHLWTVGFFGSDVLIAKVTKGILRRALREILDGMAMKTKTYIDIFKELLKEVWSFDKVSSSVARKTACQ
jgi:hypothetical protein